MVAELETEVGEQLAAKEKELKEAQTQLEGKASGWEGERMADQQGGSEQADGLLRMPAVCGAPPGACSWLPALLIGGRCGHLNAPLPNPTLCAAGVQAVCCAGQAAGGQGGWGRLACSEAW